MDYDKMLVNVIAYVIPGWLTKHPLPIPVYSAPHTHTHTQMRARACVCNSHMNVKLLEATLKS
jgi:hypothetical protein